MWWLRFSKEVFFIWRLFTLPEVFIGIHLPAAGGATSAAQRASLWVFSQVLSQAFAGLLKVTIGWPLAAPWIRRIWLRLLCWERSFFFHWLLISLEIAA